MVLNLIAEAASGSEIVEAGTDLVTMDNMTTAIGNVFTIVGTVANAVMSNPVTAMFFVAGVIGLGCGILGRLKHV